MRLGGRRTKRGFTLVELMIVIAMVGILATLATYGVNKYLQSSKASEAIQMIGAMKTAQEHYRSDTFVYLDVSGANALSGLSTYYPTTTPGNQAVQWGDTSTAQGKAWQTLGVSVPAPVRFTYGCAAGGASDAVAAADLSYAVTNWPTASTTPWYVVRAVGDLDGDTTHSVYASASFIDRIFIDNEGE